MGLIFVVSVKVSLVLTFKIALSFSYEYCYISREIFPQRHSETLCSQYKLLLSGKNGIVVPIFFWSSS